MKSHFCRALVCAVTIGCALPAWAQSFQLQPTQLIGIELVGPNSPEFNKLVTQVLPDAASRSILAPALPFSFIVRNVSERPIQMMTVRFEYTSPATLKPVTGIMTQSYDALPKGALELFLPSGGVSKLYGSRPTQSSLRHVSDFRSSAVVKASLDSVVYSDGQFVGPDLAQEFPRLSRESQQFNELVREILGMDNQPLDLLRARLEEISKQQADRMGRVRLWTRVKTAQMLLVMLDQMGRDHMKNALSDRVLNPPTPAVRR